MPGGTVLSQSSKARTVPDAFSIASNAIVYFAIIEGRLTEVHEIVFKKGPETPTRTIYIFSSYQTSYSLLISGSAEFIKERPISRYVADLHVIPLIDNSCHRISADDWISRRYIDLHPPIADK